MKYNIFNKLFKLTVTNHLSTFNLLVQCIGTYVIIGNLFVNL